MIEILRICGIAILSVCLGALLKSSGVPFAGKLTDIAAICILISALSSIAPLIRYIKEIGGGVIEGENISALLLRAVGIILISQTVSDICVGNGEKNLAAAVDFSCNVALLLLSLPALKSLISDTLLLLGEV